MQNYTHIHEHNNKQIHKETGAETYKSNNIQINTKIHNKNNDKKHKDTHIQIDTK